MRILVVDDHPIFLAGVEFLISSHHPDYRIKSVATARDALTQMSWCNYDLLILDRNLPDIDGIALLLEMRASRFEVPTLMMSAEEDAPFIREALVCGALGFVPKSFEPSELLDAIATVSKGETYLPAAVGDLLADGVPDPAHKLTPRQIAVLELVAEGLSNKEIAERLNLTEYTIKSHMRGLFHSLGCKNRTACVLKAQNLGILRDGRMLDRLGAPRSSRP